jgi:hypothetical protein
MNTNDISVFAERKNQCRRCNGWMGLEKFYGPNDTFFGWHCLLCGEILDAEILLNRMTPSPRILPSGRKEGKISRFKK